MDTREQTTNPTKLQISSLLDGQGLEARPCFNWACWEVSTTGQCIEEIALLHCLDNQQFDRKMAWHHTHPTPGTRRRVFSFSQIHGVAKPIRRLRFGDILCVWFQDFDNLAGLWLAGLRCTVGVALQLRTLLPEQPSLYHGART